MKNKSVIVVALMPLLLLAATTGCNKIKYTQIDEPAYLRVFNDLLYTQSIENKSGRYPALCMIIDPVFDAGGLAAGGQVVGDFLDRRDPYAPPYPSHAGNSSSVQNPEYPGKELVLAGPVLNGFDLSSWAQIPAGRHRFLFLYRPYNSTPFFQLDTSLRHDVLVDTTLELSVKEVYTLHVLQSDFITGKNGALLRQEQFHKLPLSDSLAYVNFYNYSAKGFVEADDRLKPKGLKLGSFKYGVKDRMNIFMTLYEGQNETEGGTALSNYRGKYLGQLLRNAESSAVAPYYNFPLWASRNANGINTDIWQRFEFLTPGLDVLDKANLNLTSGNYAAINCLRNGMAEFNGGNPLVSGYMLPNMLVNVHSGTNNPQTFATVNTVEIVNNNVFLTTVQRKYPVPVYQ